MTKTDWRKEHWQRGETDAEHAERVENAEREAQWYFDRVTQPQATAAKEARSVAMAYVGTPRYARELVKIDRKFAADTAAARELFEATAEEVMREGEVSEAMSERWDALMRAPVPGAADIVAAIRATTEAGNPVLSEAEAAMMVMLFASLQVELNRRAA
jgi:hypothetical protein